MFSVSPALYAYKTREFYVVRRGWLYCSTLLSDGGRQITTLHLSGDLAGDESLACKTAPFAITAVADATVRVIDKAAFGTVLAHHPRIAAILLALAEMERVALADRLVSLGRTSAKSRVAALIVDVLRRLRAGEAAVDDEILLPLTQEEIGDATGLTVVHGNRMMRELADAGCAQQRPGADHRRGAPR